VCYIGVTIPKGEDKILGENVPDNLIPLIIANWTGPCSGTRRDIRLIASLVRCIVSRKMGVGGIAHRGRSLISTIALYCIIVRPSSVEKPI